MPIALCCECVACALSEMSLDPLSYFALRFPAPVCCDCGVPMVTVTTVFDHGTADAKKVVSYQCQKCGGTLGASRLPDGRNRVSRPPLAGWLPRV